MPRLADATPPLRRARPLWLCRWFEDQGQVQRQRAEALVCLPRLPGPHSGPAPATSTSDAPGAGIISGEGGDGRSPGGGSPRDGGTGLQQQQQQQREQAHHLPFVTRGADILVVAAG